MAWGLHGVVCGVREIGRALIEGCIRTSGALHGLAFMESEKLSPVMKSM